MEQGGWGSSHLTPLWGFLGRRGRRPSVFADPTAGPCHPQVRSPLSDAILGEQALAVTEDKVSVLELRVQPVMGLSLALSRGNAHPGEVTATCWAQAALPAPKQVTAGGQGATVSTPRWGLVAGEWEGLWPLALGFQNKDCLPGKVVSSPWLEVTKQRLEYVRGRLIMALN